MESNRVFADTDLFLRYLTNDLPDQAAAFENLLRRTEKGEVTLVTSSLVIAEIVWTLESYYGLGRELIQESVMGILNTPGLEVAENETLMQAAIWYVEKNIDFIDAYNAAWSLERGITKVCTFDQRHFKRLDGIETIEPPS